MNREMPPSRLFVDPETGELDTDQILTEAIPLAKLLALAVAAALIPFVLGLAVIETGVLVVIGELFILVAQFVLAVGTGIVLLYIISRAIQLTTD